ncbi:MAG: methyltransferase domain-containing protein [Pseudomonadota bacterium]
MHREADTEVAIARHYTTPALMDRVRAALEAAGHDPSAPSPEALKPLDEFHTGGLEATEALLSGLEIGPATRVLDIGCGIGGTVRHVVGRHGCPTAGIDLTPQFVETAVALSALAGNAPSLGFHVASALDLPFEDGAFDLALMFHAGMNIEDKHALFAEAARVLAPGGRFALFDVMALDPAEPIVFPLPWSARAETSFVATPGAYLDAAAAAGLNLVAERPRGDFALAFFEKVFAHIAANGMPPLGIHLLMGEESAAEKLANYVANVKAGRIAPVEMVFAKS